MSETQSADQSDEALRERIALLEAQLTPLQEEIRRLKTRLARREAGRRSGAVRRAKTQQRATKIKARLEDAIDDLYERGSGGLVKRLAAEYGVSEKYISVLLQPVRKKLNK
ncbi:MAG: hypothetical protein HQL47_10545 [Gammaproteobacteria bacterium]|nr:hypothetical protein [Gammaproteobacteria bacterium]